MRKVIRIMLLAACWIPAGCALFLPVESLKKGELRFEYPQGEFRDNGPRPINVVERCASLYNVGRSDEWAECMGVGLK